MRRYWLDSRNPGWESIETRACVVLDNPVFGKVALLPVGMSQICSVNFSEGLAPGVEVRKGQELGYFLFGGSDFVMVFEKGVRLDLQADTQSHIFLGQPLGTLSK